MRARLAIPLLIAATLVLVALALRDVLAERVRSDSAQVSMR